MRLSPFQDTVVFALCPLSFIVLNWPTTVHGPLNTTYDKDRGLPAKPAACSEITDGSFVCCELSNPAKSCTPKDDFETLIVCDNLHGYTDIEWKFQKTEGLTTNYLRSSDNSRAAEYYDRVNKDTGSSTGSQASSTIESSSQTSMSFGITKGPVSLGASLGTSTSKVASSRVTTAITVNFGKNVGNSLIKAFNWATSSSQSWNEQHIYNVEYTVPSGVRAEIQQVVGTCGFYKIRTASVWRLEYNSAGVLFASKLSFSKPNITRKYVPIPNA